MIRVIRAIYEICGLKLSLNRNQMAKKTKTRNSLDVDKGLVAMFLKMSTEERLRINDSAARTILELRNAYKQQRANRPRPKRTA